MIYNLVRTRYDEYSQNDWIPEDIKEADIEEGDVSPWIQCRKSARSHFLMEYSLGQVQTIVFPFIIGCAFEVCTYLLQKANWEEYCKDIDHAHCHHMLI